LEENVFNVVKGKIHPVHLGDLYDGESVDPVVAITEEGTLRSTREPWSIRAQSGKTIRSVPKKLR
jgi:hypothetical protein